MHRVGPPDPDALAWANAERHFDRIVEFYLEHPDLGERVPLSFGEELALARKRANKAILDFWRLLEWRIPSVIEVGT